MSCRDCDKKTASRHGGVVGTATATPVGVGAPPDPLGNEAGPGAADPFSSFYAARELSYDELSARRDMKQRMIRESTEQLVLQMTDAMRQTHLDELIAVVNCEVGAIPGMTTDGAIVAIYEVLDRPEWKSSLVHYPGLEKAVRTRYADLKALDLPTRNKD